MRLAPATFNNRTNIWVSCEFVYIYLLVSCFLWEKKSKLSFIDLGLWTPLFLYHTFLVCIVAHVLLYGKLIKLPLEAVRSKYQIHQMRCAWEYYFIYVMNVAPILKVLVGKAFNMMGLLPKADLAYAANSPIKLFSFFKQTCTQKERERDPYSSIPTFSFWMEIKLNKLGGSKNFV